MIKKTYCAKKNLKTMIKKTYCAKKIRTNDFLTHV